MLLPQNQKLVGNVAFVLAVVAVLALTLVRGWARYLMLIPAIYIAAVAWENRLAVEPATTRLLLLGGLLVALMNIRPQGLFGSARVEIV